MQLLINRLSWAWGGWLALWGVNLALRFWGLGRIQSLVFDEVYYVPFAVDYLQQQPVFDLHPPLGKYLIALSIALFSALPGTEALAPEVSAALLNPLSYRWLNALLGAWVPLLAAWLAWELGALAPADWPRRRGTFAALTGVLTTCDGYSLMESRLGLLHTPLLFFGFLGLAAWLRSRHQPRPWPWQLLAGVALGACISVKWNGAGHWLALWLLAGLGLWRRSPQTPSRARPWLWLGLLPAGVYGLLWWPHLQITGDSFWGLHGAIWQGHLGLEATHPYQSPWYTWPLLLRPISYFYRGLGPTDSLNDLGPPVPQPDSAIALYGLGNPLLWWLAAAAVLLLLAQVITHGWQRVPVATVLGVAYLANWLPWAAVPRSTFIYHYLSSALLAEIALAWMMSRWITRDRAGWQWISGGLLGLILVGFGFWLPLWLGWSLPLEALQRRWWLPSWV